QSLPQLESCKTALGAEASAILETPHTSGVAFLNSHLSGFGATNSATLQSWQTNGPENIPTIG
ncbi:MAG TPA: hypothetical protein VN843_18120, partial [Anaerolineales bacterium]|nr:hypothetical protein [Anaerolineales bacterium]